MTCGRPCHLPMMLLLALLVALPALSQTANGLVASWDAAEIAGEVLPDGSGHGHDLQLRGATAEEFEGRVILRTGPGQCAVGPALGDGWSALSLVAVILQERDAGAYAGIACRDHYGGPTGDVFGLLTDPRGNWAGRLNTAAGQAGLTAPIEPGWHQLALTWDGATARLVVDGVPAMERALAGPLVSEPGTPLVIGAYSNLNGFFAGGVARVEVHDRALAIAELAAAWATWWAEHPQATGFSFAQAADVHITDTKSIEILNDAVDLINADPRLAFSVWLGDLTQNSQADEMTLVRMGLDRLRRPRYTLRGNHDLKDGLYEREFGELNYCFEHAGWKFIMLDTNPGDATPLDAERLDWLRAVLAATDPAQPLVLCTHHPLAPNAPSHRLAGAKDVLALFTGHNLKAVLGAHYHGNYAETVDGVLFTGTSCLATTRTNFDGSTMRGYRLFHCVEDAITTEFVPVRDVQPADVAR